MVELKWNLQFHFNSGQFHFAISNSNSNSMAAIPIPEKSPPLATRQARSYRANWATQALLFSKPLDLAQVCHGNKICSKPALTWKLTLVLAFPAHCISN